YITNEQHVEYMAFPRLAALAEALWTPRENLDFGGFSRRMAAQYARYDAAGLNYRVPYPQGYEALNPVTENSVSVELTNGIPGSVIYYTTDGSEPDLRSDRYYGPLTLKPEKEIILKSVTVMPGGRKSAVMSGIFRKTEIREATGLESLNPGLRFSMYRGEFSSVADITGEADSVGIVNTIRIPVGAPSANFGLSLDGYIMVPADGIYTLYAGTDDGVRIWIDDELTLDGDVLHHGITNEGRIALRAGYHAIKVLYFQRLYRQSLSVSWEGPGVTRQAVPQEVLFQ
ncbi:MAG: PA14 domain-containing protein, partial [Actinomycetota bacterium]